MSDWSPDTIERLKHFVITKKMSAGEAQIAMAQEGFQFSRNAIIGKVHRLGLAFWRKPSNVAKARRPDPATPRVVNTSPRVARIVASRNDAEADPPMPANKKAVAPVMERAVETEEVEWRTPTLLELRSNQCRWPLGKFHDKPPYFYCGAPVSEEGCSWCSQHRRAATLGIKETRHAVGVEA